MNAANAGSPVPGTPAWDDLRWQTLPSLNSDLQCEICVVGLGGTGLTAIDELLSAGVDVIGIDAGSIAGGAAGRNGGFLLGGTARFYHQTLEMLDSESARALYLRTLSEIDRIAAATPDVVFRNGSLRIADSAEEARDCDLQFAAMRAHGLPVERYEGHEGRGLLFPQDAAFNPLQRCRTLAKRMIERGARLFENTAATKITPGCVTTPDVRIVCKHVIVAVDGNLEIVLPELQGEVRTARLQMLGTAPTDEITVPRPVYVRWGYEYWQQTCDRRIVLGGFRDKHIDTEWTHSHDPTTSIQSLLEEYLRRRVGVHTPITHRWAASVGYTANAMPLVREVKPRVWALGGYNGTGNVVGALCAREVAGAVLGRHAESPGFLQTNSR
jgi:gamma-glutamylputrescine oxidase